MNIKALMEALETDTPQITKEEKEFIKNYYKIKYKYF